MGNNESIEFICLGSGSSGNSYVLRKGSECVLVECGFEFKKLMLKLAENDIKLSQIKAVIVSHKHKDHSFAVKDFIDGGFNVYIPDTLGFGGDNVHIIKDKATFHLTSWLSVHCFPVFHDTECFGFIFYDREVKESTLFITDSKLFDFEYKNYSFDYIFIECNHIRKQLEVVMQTALDNGKAGDVFKYKRQAAYHLSLAATKKFLSNLKHLEKTKGIFLIHLSKEVCNDVVVKTEIKTVFGIKTFVCYKEGGIN